MAELKELNKERRTFNVDDELTMKITKMEAELANVNEELVSVVFQSVVFLEIMEWFANLGVSLFLTLSRRARSIVVYKESAKNSRSSRLKKERPDLNYNLVEQH